MIQLKKAVITLCFVVLCSISVKASHVVGGELSYRCLGNNNYEFTLKLYRDCTAGTAQFDRAAPITVYKASNNAVVRTFNVLIGDTSYLTFGSSNPCLVVPPNVCVEEAIYTIEIPLPPVEGGYIVAYQRCCRNAAVMNLVDPLETGATYFDVLNDSALAQCNASPVFKNYPPIVLCANEPFTFDNSATDLSGDKLVYELCQPYTSSSNQFTPITPPPFTGVSYLPAYSYASPMNTSEALKIDSITGQLTVTPSDIGRFVIGICVSEYKNGVFLSQTLRDFQFIVVNCKPQAFATFPSDSNDCLGDTIHFQNFSTDNATYHWDFGDPTVTNDTSDKQFPSYVYTKTGSYTVSLTVLKAGTKCGDTTTSVIKINPLPTAGDDTTIVYGTSANLWAKGGPAATFRWKPGASLNDSTAATPLASPDATTTYTVTIITNEDCEVTKEVVVKVSRDPIIKFYNAFSPNNDGKNDFFHPLVVGALNNVMFKVYNRWGQVVYESESATARGWDGTHNGTPQEVGVYQYFFECVGAQDAQKFTYKGNVTLLR